MNKVRRAAVTAAAFVLMLFSGCTAAGTQQAQKPAETAAPESSAALPEIPENILGEPSSLVPEVTVDQYAVPENAGMKFVEELKLGWNLGNAFDAADVRAITAEHELDYESAWCGCATTAENIAAIKAAGFRTVRIPVCTDTEDTFFLGFSSLTSWSWLIWAFSFMMPACNCTSPLASGTASTVPLVFR